METTPDTRIRWEELAGRTSNGLEVTLPWQPDHDDVQGRGLGVASGRSLGKREAQTERLANPCPPRPSRSPQANCRGPT